MSIPETDLAEFKQLWKETYDEEIDDESAQEYARQLLGLLSVVYCDKDYTGSHDF